MDTSGVGPVLLKARLQAIETAIRSVSINDSPQNRRGGESTHLVYQILGLVADVLARTECTLYILNLDIEFQFSRLFQLNPFLSTRKNQTKIDQSLNVPSPSGDVHNIPHSHEMCLTFGSYISKPFYQLTRSGLPPGTNGQAKTKPCLSSLRI